MIKPYTCLRGFTGPEDIALTPDGTHLVVSEMPAGFVSPDGPALMQVDLANDRVSPMPIRFQPEPGWGDPACGAPTGIASHGLHISQRPDGRTQLLVINHARESVEAFEIVPSAGSYDALWHGGVKFEGGLLNDVAATPDGGFIATVMLDNALIGDQDPMAFMFSGAKTGYLAEWHPQSGWKRLPGSEAELNNGIQISNDGRYVWFAAWISGEVLEYDRAAQRITRVAKMPFQADNLTLNRDGLLVVAGIDDLDYWRECTEAEGKLCQEKLAFSVATLDPASFTVRPLFQGTSGLLQGGASVALANGNALYIGSYTGECLLKVDLSESGDAA